MEATNHKSFLIQWNNVFICDRWWRNKYQISFNSARHREICQIDIWLEYIEEKLFNQAEKERTLMQEKKELFEQGKWISQRSQEAEEDEDLLFSKINMESLNGSIGIEE